MTYSLRFTFPTTNNEVEYEALIAGLRIAQTLRAQAIKVHYDSQVIVNQVLGKYVARSETLERYLKKVQALKATFPHFQLVCIPREQNTRPDTLSKSASSSFANPVEEVRQRSIDVPEVNLASEERPTWMTPITNYLEKGELLDDKVTSFFLGPAVPSDPIDTPEHRQ